MRNAYDNSRLGACATGVGMTKTMGANELKMRDDLPEGWMSGALEANAAWV